ncbi:hypothetical protein PVT68_07060 [Microbulbifer bruguierae]|uniref:Uncharacterized protein n=1 Tax=Microbulbifer bruguierae TaxID=3029061 RepID=A0ABY8NHX0_9GAMM|nr:hypothetical protein [Microbulbifer bruguierae]WGL18050.1 hypothetical protein PVT68_07060 [Microbulbifer bruguierae]
MVRILLRNSTPSMGIYTHADTAVANSPPQLAEKRRSLISISALASED